MQPVVSADVIRAVAELVIVLDRYKFGAGVVLVLAGMALFAVLAKNKKQKRRPARPQLP